MLGVAALLTMAAAAAEPPGGAANFRPPGYVPDYFSNESGAFRGAAAVAAPSSAAPVVAAPSQPTATETVRHVARRSLHAARADARHRRLARRGAHHPRRPAIHAVRARAGKAAHVVARRRPTHRSPGKSVAAKRSNPPAKGKHLARASG